MAISADKVAISFFDTQNTSTKQITHQSMAAQQHNANRIIAYFFRIRNFFYQLLFII